MPEDVIRPAAEPVNEWFQLSRANYLVLNRALLELMPEAWQLRFVRCLVELRAAFEHVHRAPGFRVQPVDEEGRRIVDPIPHYRDRVMTRTLGPRPAKEVEVDPGDYPNGELADAALAYLLEGSDFGNAVSPTLACDIWPFELHEFKAAHPVFADRPDERVRCLEAARTYLDAEIERLRAMGPS